MKRLVIFLLPLFLFSCANEVTNSELFSDDLNFHISVQKPESRASLVENSFPEGSKLGVFLYPKDDLTISIDKSFLYPITLTNGKWIADNGDYRALDDKDYVAYSFYPFSSESQFDKANNKILIETTSQKDYLFGTMAAGKTINKSNTNVHLTMEHMLSLIELKIIKDNKDADHRLTKIRLVGTNNLYTKGYFSPTSKQIAFDTGSVGEVVDNNTYTLPYKTDNYNSYNFPKLITFPQSTTGLKFIFTVDKVDYEISIPARTWEAGKKYTYNLSLIGTYLKYDANSVTITDWIDVVIPDVYVIKN